jgi:hypothetical protein
MNTLAPIPKPRPPRKRPNRSEAKIVSNARLIMDLLVRDACDRKTTPVVRSTIARAYAVLGDAIRVWRGVPSPGQLRPDLDPVQLAKALKRSRSRHPIELASLITFEAPSETPPTTTTEQKGKESLSQDGTVPTDPTPGGT